MKQRWLSDGCLNRMLLVFTSLVAVGSAGPAAGAPPLVDAIPIHGDPTGIATKQNTIDKILELTKHLASSEGNSQFLFEPQDLQEIVRKHIGLPLEEALPAIHQDLQSRYPGKILDHYRFIFNDAGAALGQVAILYASASEYLIFFGSPIPTGGFSGRYDSADFYDIMIAGEMSTVIEGQIKKQTYKPGDMALLSRGSAKAYELDESGWMLEYSRGKMINSFAFGVIGPAMFITMDWKSAMDQVTDFAKAMFKSSR